MGWLVVSLFLFAGCVSARWDVFPVDRIHNGHLKTTADDNTELMTPDQLRLHYKNHAMPGLIENEESNDDLLQLNAHNPYIVARLPFSGKPLPPGLENEPTGGVSNFNTDMNMMRTEPAPRSFTQTPDGIVTVNSAGPAPHRNYVAGSPSWAVPENGSDQEDLVAPEDEMTTGEVRDGLLMKVMPVRLPNNAEPQDVGTDPWDYMANYVQTSLDPVFEADVGPEGVSPDAPPAQNAVQVARMVVTKQHRMGNMFGPDFTIYGRETFSYDPTIPSNKIMQHVDMPELDLSPRLAKEAKKRTDAIDYNKGYTSDEWEKQVLHLNYADSGAEEDPEDLKN